jgi:hypothetical protein
MIEKLIISYYNHIQHIDKIKNNHISMNIDQEQKDDMILELENQNNEILKTILMFDNKIDIEYIKNNYVTLYENYKKSWNAIKESITRNMHLAYYDLLCEDIEKGNNVMLLNIIKDIEKKIINIRNVPNYITNNFIDKFNTNNLANIFENNVSQLKL